MKKQSNNIVLQVARRSAASKKGQPPKEPGKGQLWDGLVSIILVEGKKMIPMDDSGGCGMASFGPLLYGVGSNLKL